MSFVIFPKSLRSSVVSAPQNEFLCYSARLCPTGTRPVFVQQAIDMMH